VLAALSMIVLALMVALSFNLSQALHEKIRLQQHSDAQAYSMATLQARSLNYFATSNRAMAAAYVSANSLHAYMAAASVTSEMMESGRNNMIAIAVEEGLQCNPYQPQHCAHAIEAGLRAADFQRVKGQYDNRVRDVEGTFRAAMTALNLMIDTIHASQKLVFVQTGFAMGNGTSLGLDQLKRTNAPRASNIAGGVGALNVNQYSCVIDGMPCLGGAANTDNDTKAKVMTEIANATRPQFPADRTALVPSGLGWLIYLHPTFVREITTGVQGNGFSMAIAHQGTAKTIESASQGQLHSGSGGNNTGKVTGADEHGWLITQWRDGIFTWPYKAEIYSDDNNGSHNNGGHTGNHNFPGIYSSTLCVMSGHCFMKFRSNSNRDQDFGQPKVYSYVTQPLRQGTVEKAPWQLNSSATVTWEGDCEDGRLTLAPGDGAALSKAMVYYHRIGDWQEQPNLFNPYWRAKLHPFTAAEAAIVLGAGGNTEALPLAAVPRMPL
jgi:hypothetical protein